MQLDKSEIIYKRLISNNLQTYYTKGIDQFLAFTGPVQAQDPAQVRWAIASRFETLNEQNVLQALEKRSIIRTWGLRGTLHIMRREDVSWIVDLVGPIFNAKHKGTLAKAGFSEGDLEKSLNALRQQMGSGPVSREELARRYFQSHGPATIEDFCQWSSLTKTSAKKAIEKLINLEHYSCEGKSYFALGDLDGEYPQMPSVHLLAGFDEYILGYKDRTLVLRDDIFNRVVSVNGIFRPSVLIHGEVAGIWKRSIKRDELSVDFELFQIVNAKLKDALYACVERFKKYLQLEQMVVTGL